MMSNHITYFDFLRGIAIVMVVLIHCTGIINFEGANNIMTMAFRECLNCAVPIFIAISGYFMCLKPVDNPKDYLSFIKKYVPAVWVPMALWSIPAASIAVYHGASIIKELSLLIVGGISIYYFISLIIQYYLLTPIIKKVNIKRVFFCGIITFCWAIFITYWHSIKGNWPLLVQYAGVFPASLLWYALGCWFRIVPLKRESSILPWIIIAGCAIIGQFFESRWLAGYGGVGIGDIKISTVTYDMAIIFVVFSKKVERIYNVAMSKKDVNNGILRFINYLGRTSFGLYLAHMYVLGQIVNRLERVFYKAGIVTMGTNGILLMLIKATIVIAITVALLEFIKFIVNKLLTTRLRIF